MREILFRGKLPDGEWVEGYVVKGSCTYILTAENIHYMCVSVIGHANVDVLPVKPETVGQYTGLVDKNGKRIYEGDILAFPDTGEDGYEYKEGYDFTNVATVCWNNGRWELEDFGDENSGVKDDMECCRHEDFIEIFPCCEVIGNIHDNPEMIGGKGDDA